MAILRFLSFFPLMSFLWWPCFDWQSEKLFCLLPVCQPNRFWLDACLECGLVKSELKRKNSKIPTNYRMAFLLIHRERPFPDPIITRLMQQLLNGLNYMHRHGFFHRDIKPENLLCQGPTQLKIADFGLARETRSRPPYTDYVSTRWYRAPEVLLRCTNYGSPIDMWAVGCILAELYTLKPLFAGRSEIDQLFKICTVLGSPNDKELISLARALNFKFPPFTAQPLQMTLPSLRSEALQLLTQLLQWNASKRPNAAQSLRHAYFRTTNADAMTGNETSIGKTSTGHHRRAANSMIRSTDRHPSVLPEPTKQGQLKQNSNSDWLLAESGEADKEKLQNTNESMPTNSHLLQGTQPHLQQQSLNSSLSVDSRLSLLVNQEVNSHLSKHTQDVVADASIGQMINGKWKSASSNNVSQSALNGANDTDWSLSKGMLPLDLGQSNGGQSLVDDSFNTETSIKDQYFSRSRYIAGQSSKNAFRSECKERFKQIDCWPIAIV